jgi:hypothetical protein
MHGMPCEQSIILLDEPDLHLSDFAKSSFYDELYRVAHVANCQVIISTHSAFANSSAVNAHRFFIRRVIETKSGVPRVVFRTEWDPHFGELLTFHYARCAVKAMAESGLVWRFLSVPLNFSVFVGKYVGVQVWTALTILAACTGLYAIFAMLNDLWWPLVRFDPAFHKHFIVDSAIICGVVCTIFLFLRFAPLNMDQTDTHDV